MASASHPPAHPALQSADRLILSPQQPPAAVETSIGPPHYPAECTQSDQTRSFNRACAPARGTQTLIRFPADFRSVWEGLETCSGHLKTLTGGLENPDGRSGRAQTELGAEECTCCPGLTSRCLSTGYSLCA